jgi:uncharacterized protein (DUF488 family)
MEIATIGFTQSSAESFFGRLRQARVRRVLDIRLHNASQLSGFAKAGDLRYFLKAIEGIAYAHDVRLAPTEALLESYRKRQVTWDQYVPAFLELMRQRNIPEALDPASFGEKTALLCSEATAARCHRRLVAELLADRWGAGVEHL